MEEFRRFVLIKNLGYANVTSELPVWQAKTPNKENTVSQGEPLETKDLFSKLDRNAMQLPHRPPFLFVDEIVLLEPGYSVHCRRIFPSADPVFKGHFPGNPVVPGVLLTEALAQGSGLILKPRTPDGCFLLAAIQRMKFPNAARPEECIDLFSSLITTLDGLFRFGVLAKIQNKVVAEGDIILCEP